MPGKKKTGISEKKMRDALSFSSKTVLVAYDHDEVMGFLKALPPEEQEKCFEEKETILKPLSEKEIKELSFELLENGYEGENIFGKTTAEKLQILRENTDKLNLNNGYDERINLDEAIASKELKWSSSNAWNVLKNHIDINIP